MRLVIAIVDAGWMPRLQIVIDCLQLLASGKREESRQQEVSEFSRALKRMAMELQVPVIALSQLNRGAEQRADKKPALMEAVECATNHGLFRDVRTEEELDSLERLKD